MFIIILMGIKETYGFYNLQVHPDARSFRIKTIPHYNDLCLIYKDAPPEPKGN